MSTFPLQQLVQLRAVRRDRARAALLECQTMVRERESEVQRIEAEMKCLQTVRSLQRRRQLDPPESGADWARVLAQREVHIDHITEQLQAAADRRQQAQERLREAEDACALARIACFRAQARVEALEQREARWNRDRARSRLQQQEASAEDLWRAPNMLPRLV